MNQRTAKLLRRYAQHSNLKYRSAKKWWISEARTDRPMLRRMMNNILTLGHP